MTETRTRLLAALTTAASVAATAFEAHIAPQGSGMWRGVTGSLSFRDAVGGVAAGLLVWLLGRATNVRIFFWMTTAFLPFFAAATGAGAPLLAFSRHTMILLFTVLVFVAAHPLLARFAARSSLAVFAVAFVFFVSVGKFIPGAAGPQGDEPHYLLIAESLLRDGDLDLKNQFENRAYSSFTSAALQPHTAPRSPKGKVYAIHTPGLAVVILPGYAIAGYAGARAVLSLGLAVAVALLHLTARSKLGEDAAAFVAVAATLATPLPVYANSVFPDSAAVFAVAAAFAALAVERPSLAVLAAVGIAWLPWLHPRFVPLAILLAFFLCLKNRLRPVKIVLFAVPLLVSVFLLLFHFQTLFGAFSLSAAYGPAFAADISLARIPEGAAALVLDRQFGLLLFAPLLIVGAAGISELWNRDKNTAALAVFSVALLLGIGGAFSMWWGGASAPARFVIGAAPALLLLLGARWRSADQKQRALLSAAAGFGCGLLWLACLAPRALHNRPDGASGLLRLLSPSLDLDRFFPGFLSSEGGAGILAAWVVVLLAAAWRPVFGAFALVLPVVIGGVDPRGPLLDSFPASLRALESWNDHRRTLGGRDDPAGFELKVPLGGDDWSLAPQAVAVSPRFSLPAGTWTFAVESESAPSSDALNLARVSIVDDDENSLASLWLEAGAKESRATLTLAGDERRLRLQGEGYQSRARVVAVRLSPRALGSPKSGAPLDVR